MRFLHALLKKLPLSRFELIPRFLFFAGFCWFWASL
jgi:hypothetical protein